MHRKKDETDKKEIDRITNFIPYYISKSQFNRKSDMASS